MFFLLCAGIYLSPILVIGGWDRYYIPALPFLLVGIAGVAAASWQPQTPTRVTLAALLLVAAVAGGTLVAVAGVARILQLRRRRSVPGPG